MYLPSHFRSPNDEAALTLIQAYPLGTIVSIVQGKPFVTYAPFIITQREPAIVLTAHMAKANPHWRSIDTVETLVAFHGPHAYVSPRWYNDRTHNVPTWNYATVHCIGSVSIVPEPENDAVLQKLVATMESGVEDAWSMEELEPQYRQEEERGIVAFHVAVREMRAKFKLSQNRSADDRAGVVNGLLGSTNPQDRELAELMLRLNESTSGVTPS